MNTRKCRENYAPIQFPIRRTMVIIGDLFYQKDTLLSAPLPFFPHKQIVILLFSNVPGQLAKQIRQPVMTIKAFWLGIGTHFCLDDKFDWNRRIMLQEVGKRGI